MLKTVCCMGRINIEFEIFQLRVRYSTTARYPAVKRPKYCYTTHDKNAIRRPAMLRWPAMIGPTEFFWYPVPVFVVMYLYHVGLFYILRK